MNWLPDYDDNHNYDDDDDDYKDGDDDDKDDDDDLETRSNWLAVSCIEVSQTNKAGEGGGCDHDDEEEKEEEEEEEEEDDDDSFFSLSPILGGVAKLFRIIFLAKNGIKKSSEI